MMKKKKIILSFDYELFFGDKSGTVMESLIKPTNLLLDAMDSVGSKGNFFIDWLMLKYLKAENTSRTDSDYQLIVDQLMDIVRRGHRIELHIHPHWVDAKYNGDGTWDFSEFRHYSLNSFSETDIVKMFVEGTNLLTNIARLVDPEYEIVAFRAGGWAVQPFEKLRKGFQSAGIKIDSSVARGAYGKNQYSFFDFRTICTNNNYAYRFDNDVTIEDIEGEFLEIPISTYRRTVINKIVDKLFRILSPSSKVITDGTHHRDDLQWQGKSLCSMVTLSKISPFSSIMSVLLQDTSLVTIIDHPKDYTQSASLSIKILSKLFSSVQYNVCTENRRDV